MSVAQIHSTLEGLFLIDLSKQVSKQSLMRMAFEAVDAANWPPPSLHRGNGTPVTVLRTLLPFCYCTGLFCSREIELAAEIDPHVCYLSSNRPPGSGEIRAFRRASIPWVRETLARMLHAVAIELGYAVSQSNFLPFLAEADRRLRLSIEEDSASLDE